MHLTYITKILSIFFISLSLRFLIEIYSKILINNKSIPKLKSKVCKGVLEIKTSLNNSKDYMDKTINTQSSRFSKYYKGI